MVFAHELLDSTNLRPGKPTAALQPDWVELELRDLVATLNVNMLGFISISRVEEETIWTDSQYRWHLSQLHTDFSPVTHRALSRGRRATALFERKPRARAAAAARCQAECQASTKGPIRTSSTSGCACNHAAIPRRSSSVADRRPGGVTKISQTLPQPPPHMRSPASITPPMNESQKRSTSASVRLSANRKLTSNPNWRNSPSRSFLRRRFFT